jgi:thiosulfate/3-mercaptopyruvate sulfurtransferase
MLVSTAELASILGSPDLAVVHVGKDRKGYDAGHAPGARFLPLGAVAVKRGGVPGMFPEGGDLLEVFRRLGVDEDDRVVFCDDEVGGFAARGWMAMEVLGRRGQAALLDGQMARWRAEGRPLATEEPPPARPSSLRPVIDRLVIADLAEVRRLVEDRRRGADRPVALVDARPSAEFSGEKPGEEIARPGRIPGFTSLPYTDLVESKENPVLKPPAEIRALFEAAGVGPGGDLVASCRTGRQASLAYFAAILVGLRPRLYDGSFIEWQADPANEVAR